MCNAKQKHRFSAMAMALLVSVSLLPGSPRARAEKPGDCDQPPLQRHQDC